mmetsp:Transcript_137767/g.343865  ORF Transcript_137767/g.343865 Transcript_137767/m.343865 type:complete len:176 (-) Transcript_137767:297-824(-)
MASTTVQQVLQENSELHDRVANLEKTVKEHATEIKKLRKQLSEATAGQRTHHGAERQQQSAERRDQMKQERASLLEQHREARLASMVRIEELEDQIALAESGARPAELWKEVQELRRELGKALHCKQELHEKKNQSWWQWFAKPSCCARHDVVPADRPMVDTRQTPDSTGGMLPG